MDGTLVSAETFEQMATRPELNDGSTSGYGLGIQIGEFQGRRILRHGGSIFGWNTTYLMVPDADLFVAIQRIGRDRIEGICYVEDVFPYIQQGLLDLVFYEIKLVFSGLKSGFQASVFASQCSVNLTG